jgi:hypothetical protein
MPDGVRTTAAAVDTPISIVAASPFHTGAAAYAATSHHISASNRHSLPRSPPLRSLTSADDVHRRPGTGTTTGAHGVAATTYGHAGTATDQEREVEG